MVKIKADAEAPKFTFGLEPRNVDEGVRHLTMKFGRAAVKEASKRLTKAKTGRKAEQDESELREVYDSDAELWLAGKNPLKLRSNRKIAQDIATRKPGHSSDSTKRRIMQKLSKDRRVKMLWHAALVSRDKHRHENHIKAVKAALRVVSAGDKKILEYWQKDYSEAVQAYCVFTSNEPPKDWSFKQIDDFNKSNNLTGLSKILSPLKIKQPKGLLG